MLQQDIGAGQGCALFDPHGDLLHEVVKAIPPERASEVTYLDVPNPEMRWHFNPFSGIAPSKHALAAAGIVEVFKKIWPDDWGPRLEHLLRNVVFTLLESSGTLADIPSLLTDRVFRARIVANLNNGVVRAFWTDEFERYSLPFRAVVIAPLQNKIGALLTDPLLRRILTEAGPSLDLREITNKGKILLVNLDKGRIGEGPATLLGSFLLSHIALVGIGRSAQAAEERSDFFVYLDEFQIFTTESLANMLSELRKYRVGLILAHQYLDQLDPAIRDAVFGNVGSMLSFRVGGADAAFLAREFAPRFDITDLTSLPRFSAYVRLMIDGATSQPFSATTIETWPDTANP
jgi:hypothetical protein